MIADGVDDEPAERNRRLFEGPFGLILASLATFYAAFHLLALNGVSVSAWTGVDLPFLPQFPLETWNFRIIHIAGALGLGFLVFASHTFSPDKEGPASSKTMTLIGALLAIPALIAGATAIGYVGLINSGTLPQMGWLTTWAAFPGTDIYTSEVRWFGIPLLIATGGAIGLGWVERSGRDGFVVGDIVLALCAMVVALYFVTIYGTAARNSVGTTFVPIGVAFAATDGAAMILELTRLVAGLALVIITGVFLLYTFTAHLMPGILAVTNPYSWQRFFGHVYSDAGILCNSTALS